MLALNKLSKKDLYCYLCGKKLEQLQESDGASKINIFYCPNCKVGYSVIPQLVALETVYSKESKINHAIRMREWEEMKKAKARTID